MAFLVCYTRGGVVDWRDKAIYLDQEFSELLGAVAATLDSRGVLVEMVRLAYGDAILLSRPRLRVALDELARMEGASLASHPQFGSLIAVVRCALDSDAEISIAGDMHPERR